MAEGAPRRKFLKRLLDIFLGGSFLFAAWGIVYPIWRYLTSVARLEAETGFERVVVSTTRALPPGEARLFRYQGRPYVVVNERGGISALSAVCTHKGCLVRWDKRKGELSCPCHGSAFDLNGNVKRGPAPKPLASIQVRVIQDQIVVGGL